MSQSIVFSTQNPSLVLPDIIYIDTNAIAELAFNRRHQNGVSDFLRSAASNSTLIVYSSHTSNELCDTTHVEVLKEEVSANGFRGNGTSDTPLWKQYENTGVNVGPRVSLRYQGILELLKTYGTDLFYELENPPNVHWRLRTDRFVHNGLAPKDARHAAIMHYHGINNIFTLDAGFIKTPDFNIYAPNPKVTRYANPNGTANQYTEEIP